MAGELLSDPSLGYGLGLAVPVNSQGLEYAARGIQMDEARKQRAAAAKKAADDELKELGIKAPIVNPIYQSTTNETVAGFGRNLYDLAKSGNPDAIWKAKDEQARAVGALNAQQEASKMADIVNQTRYQAMNNKNTELSDYGRNFFEEYDKSVAQKRPTEEFKKLTGNDQGFITPSITGQLYQDKSVNLTQYAPKFAKALGLTSYKTEADLGDVFETISGKGINKDKVKEDIRQTILAGDAEGKAILKQYGAGVDVDAAVEGFYGLVKNKIPSASATTLTAKPIGYSKENVAQALSTEQTIQTGGEAVTQEGAPVTGRTKAKMWTHAPISVGTIVAEGVVDIKTGKPINRSATIEGKVNQVVNIKFRKGTDALVTESEETLLRNSGQLDQIEERTVSVFSGIEKVKVGRNEETVPVEYYLPINSVKQTIETSKNKVPVAEFVADAEKMTASYSGKVAPATKAASKKAVVKKSPVKKTAKDYGL